MRSFVLLFCLVGLAGCGGGGPGFLNRGGGGETPVPAPEASAQAEAEAGEPLSAPQRAEVPSAEAATVEEFDTTSAAEREVAAAAEETTGARQLGRTVASLGSPSEPGFWIETPLVTEVRQGRLDYPATGKSVQVELRPSGGAPGSGSRVSLPAMRVLDAPLGALPELIVFAL